MEASYRSGVDRREGIYLNWGNSKCKCLMVCLYTGHLRSNEDSGVARAEVEDAGEDAG